MSARGQRNGKLVVLDRVEKRARELGFIGRARSDRAADYRLLIEAIVLFVLAAVYLIGNML